MRRTRGIALAASVLLAACGNQGEGREEHVAADRNVEDRTPYEQLDNVATTETESYGGPGAAPVTPVQGGATLGGPLTATGQFQGANGNQSPGSVTLVETANGTRLSIQINGYTGNARLKPSIIRGNCRNPGAVVQAAPQSVNTGDSGIANLETEVSIPTAQLLDGRHAIQLTADQGSGGVVGCADLPAQR